MCNILVLVFLNKKLKFSVLKPNVYWKSTLKHEHWCKDEITGDSKWKAKKLDIEQSSDTRLPPSGVKKKKTLINNSTKTVTLDSITDIWQKVVSMSRKRDYEHYRLWIVKETATKTNVKKKTLKYHIFAFKFFCTESLLHMNSTENAFKHCFRIFQCRQMLTYINIHRNMPYMLSFITCFRPRSFW